MSEHALQNFFALVKALAAEAKEQSVASDGQHHYEQAEKDLLAKCASLSLLPALPS